MFKSYKPVSLMLLSGALVFSGSLHAELSPSKPGTQIAQQQGKVSGTIVDYMGPVTGASVVVKGTTNGNITDFDGKFTLENVPNGATIQISYIGYITQELKYTGQSSLNITLEEDTQKLNEVVVTALGMSREKKALGYAMTEISGEEIAKINVVNPISGLQGKVAGVQINMGAGGPQSASRILIRGNTSLGVNNQPIFVIDGVIIDNNVTNSAEWGSQMDFGNDIKNLNPDDFESVSVLKGAAATALYGSRAANGIVLITTKKGKQGEGIGVTVSQSMTWDKVYGFPDIQHKFGPGETTVWGLNDDGSINRNAGTVTQNFGPAFDGLEYIQGGQKMIYADQKNNIKQMYQTGKYMNTNVAVQGGGEKGTFRLSYSHLKSNGTTFNNDYSRNSLNFNGTRDISKILSAEFGATWVHSDSKNPTYQGGGKSPIYDFMYSVPRTYNTAYWLQNYKNAKGDGANTEDPIEYSRTIWEYLENNYTQVEDNFRGYAKLKFKLTDWLSLNLMGDINKLYSTNERKILATGTSNYDGSEYRIDKNDKDQYKLTAMLSASKTFGDFGVNGSAAVEQWDSKTSYFKSNTNGGLRIPGVFDITNSVKQATSSMRLNTQSKRINSVFAFVNLDWRSQVFLDITGRNDWASSLIYTDGTGNVSYFYPSISSSWIVTQSLRDQLPSAISFAKIRASYAIVGKDTDPYLTSIGYYKLNDDPTTYVNPLDGNEYPWYVFDANELRNLNFKPERQHALEAGLEMKFINNRIGFDLAVYKTNTKNQIIALSQANETGMQKRWVNAGNIQNSGIEFAVNAVPFETKDWRWDVNVNVTHNKNKIISLIEGLDKYEIEGGGMDMTAYATVGGAYGDIYTAYTFARNDNGEKILNSAGAWKRSGVTEKVGSIQPKLLGGMSTTVAYKDFSLGVVLDARFGGDIVSGSLNYGSYSGTLKSTLYGRTQEYGGLERKLEDGRTVYDGMIPDGVFEQGVTQNGVDVSGMTYQEAYDRGLVQPVSAYNYYNNLYSWGTGIREAAVRELSWVALREISFRWTLPRKWVNQAFMQSVNVGLVARNLGYLYNSLPDNIHPEGLASNRSSDFVERGGSAYTRSFGFNINVAF